MTKLLTTRRKRSGTRVGAIYTQLRDLAYARGPEVKLPTLMELQELYSASQATIVGALDELEAHNIIYRRDRLGIFVSPHVHYKRICVLLEARMYRSPLTSPFWGSLWSNLTAESQARAAVKLEEYSFHLSNTTATDGRGLPESLMKLLDAGHMHGILAIGLRHTLLNRLTEIGIPMVTFACPGQYRVREDGTDVIRLGVEALARQGCERIGYWSPSYRGDFDSEAKSATRVFPEVLERHGLSHYPGLVRLGHEVIADDEANENVEEQGFRLAMQVFGESKSPRPDGLIIQDDMMTMAALAALHILGVRIGPDLKIATHANTGSPILCGYEGVITRIEFDPAAIVHQMFAMLETLMKGDTPASEVVVRPTIRNTGGRSFA